MFASCSSTVAGFHSSGPSHASSSRKGLRACAEQYECRVCQRSFAKQYNLQIHERTSHGAAAAAEDSSALHSCDVCGKVFKRYDAMRNHKVMHSPPSMPKELKGFLKECVTY